MCRKPTFKGVFTVAFVRRCSVKKVFLKILRNPQENACTKVSKLQPATILKKRLYTDVLQWISQIFYKKHNTLTSNQNSKFYKTIFGKHLPVTAFVFTNHENFSTYCCTVVSANAVISKYFIREINGWKASLR